MSKVVLLVVIVAGVYLFRSQYDLYEKEGSFSDQYILRESGLSSKDDCKKIARRYDNPYQCRKTSAWGKLLGKNSDYYQEKKY